ncbi:hypothetical protein OAO34_06200 [Candidatus Poseidoniaceae archaeon]|nr:hypothetical protein [Candidatus Poseidoniaceae archaeon]
MADPIFSPDGKFLWTGSGWIPTPPSSTPSAQSTTNFQDSVMSGDVDQSISNTNITISTVNIGSEISPTFDIESVKDAISRFIPREIEIKESEDISKLIDLLKDEMPEQLKNLQFLRLGQKFQIHDQWSKEGGLYQIIGYDLETKWVFVQKSNYVPSGSSREIKGLFGKKKIVRNYYRVIGDVVGIYALTHTEFCSIYRGDGSESCEPPLAIENWNKREIISSS